jgi:hypothetical protein
MSISAVSLRANRVLDEYNAKRKCLESDIAAKLTRQRLLLAAVLAGVISFIVLLCMALSGAKLFIAAQAVPLFVAFWAFRSLLRLRAESLELAHKSSFYERGIDRLEGNWQGKGSTGLDFARGNHLYQSDLSLFGDGSLFELLCTTRSEAGAERLAVVLLDPPSLTEARARQEAVKELRGSPTKSEVGQCCSAPATVPPEP